MVDPGIGPGLDSTPASESSAESALKSALKGKSVSEEQLFGETWPGQPWVVIAILFSAAVIGNSFGTMVFFTETYNAFDNELMLCALLGPMISELCLLTIWLALGKQNFLVRAALALGMLFGLVGLYIITFQFYDRFVGAEFAIGVVGAVVVLMVFVSIPLWIFRLTSGRSIGRDHLIGDDVITTSQFGIRHLLLTMTTVAVLTVIAQKALPEGPTQNVPWIEVLGFVTVYSLAICLICMVALGLVFNRSARAPFAILMLGMVIAGPSLATFVMTFMFRFSNYSMYVNSIAFAVTLALTVTIVLGVFYAMGFRLRRDQLVA